MDEFALIAKYLKPLATDPGAFGLADDAAILPGPQGTDWVLTKDALVEGIHFVVGTPEDLVARKLLRVNLSDLAAKGAKPFGYLLACVWPQSTQEESFAHFARGLELDQAEFGLKLLGGDTTATNGPAAHSLTAIGQVDQGKMVRRSGASPGDIVLMTGTLGDAGLGCQIAQKKDLGLDNDDTRFLLDRYQLPQPRLAFSGQANSLFAASIDISDGLMADAGHLAVASNVSVEIHEMQLPLSPAVERWVATGGSRAALAGMGDDYELCFAANPRHLAELQAAAAATNTQLSEIGLIKKGGGVKLIGANGSVISVKKQGYNHFS